MSEGKMSAAERSMNVAEAADARRIRHLELRERELEEKLSTLQREADGMREALEPFAREAAEWPVETEFGVGRSDVEAMLIGVTDDDVGRAAFTVGDLRRAAAALNGSPQVEAEKGSDRD